jgi:hypothetical protein
LYNQTIPAYFKLQLTLFNRRFSDAGILPWLGYLLSFAGFGIVCTYLYQKTDFAGYILLLLYMSIISPSGDKKRNDFLLSMYGDIVKRNIRLLENGIAAIPFLWVFAVCGDYLQSIILLFMCFSMGMMTSRTTFNKTLPTPFFKKPDEFTSGFRKTILLLLAAYTLAVIALSVDNFNLGVFTVLLIFMVCMSFYGSPEGEYFIWIHNRNPHEFLKHKLLNACKNTLTLALPVIVLLFSKYPDKVIILAGFCAVGICFLSTVILAKYSVYPSEINVPESLLIGICIFFPPAFLAVIPFFYKKSVTKLNKYLHYD